MKNREEPLKKEHTDIGRMFDSIAWRYDFLNHLLSFGVDRAWRRKAVSSVKVSVEESGILDVATGTGDLAIEAMSLAPSKIIGIDISEKMLDLGREKVKGRNLGDIIEFINCSSESICFDDNSFDAAMVAFGVRNFSDPVRGLSEMRRVIKPGGQVVVLEFSRPGRFPVKQIYNFYFSNFLPLIGTLFSKDRKAYRYLNKSVMNFADNEEFMKMMKAAGLKEVSQTRLSGGIASIYTGVKE